VLTEIIMNQSYAVRLLLGLLLFFGLSFTSVGFAWDAMTEDGAEFPNKDRYFPKVMVQYQRVLFLWDDLVDYRQDVWGDNQNGKVTLRTEKRARTSHGVTDYLDNGKLILKNQEMVWLLKRLNFGQFECRWCGLGKAEPGNDKFIGFGDPAEGYAAGYRLYSGDKGPGLYVFLVNQGQAKTVAIPWNDDFAASTRYIVSWSPGKFDFYLITATKFIHAATIAEADIAVVGIPKINMEISLQSISGPNEVMADLIKYDAYP